MAFTPDILTAIKIYGHKQRYFLGVRGFVLSDNSVSNEHTQIIQTLAQK